MAVSNSFFTIFCASLCCISLCVTLSACDGGSGEAGDNASFVQPFEDTPTPTLNAQQLNILDEIKRRSSDDGALYQFDELNPEFVQDGDTITVSFTFINPNTIGGAPIVEYSLDQSAITRIVYTQ